MAYLVFGFIGWIIGILIFREVLSLIGLAIGLLAGEIYVIRSRLAILEKKMVETIPRPDIKPETVPVRPTSPTQQVSQQEAEPQPVPITAYAGLGTPAHPPVPPPIPKTYPSVSLSPLAEPFEKAPSDGESFTKLPGQLLGHLKEFFTTGNVVTKIGVIVLFFGFAFLLKYAAQRNLFPVEFRLIGVFLGGLILLGLGWRLRDRRMLYGLLLQGCGFGVLYLTVYAAARFYDLLPYGFAFAVMSCLVVLAGILALVQNAKYLAEYSVIGGFLAPILVSTGSGSHVALFSYYALINFGIAGIALHKAWRELNLIGFMFTFVIASLWAGKYYQPEYFATTEPFLILFFLLYVVISVLYALRQPVNLKGYVDGTLVFGVPLLAFGLQVGIVHDFEYGVAVSALGLGLFYILLATILWRRQIENLRMIAESFLALGVVFGTLAIPMALDGRWTSAAWALEGCAILWVGIRQNRLLPCIFGILLQIGSGISFLLAFQMPFDRIPFANSFFIGCLIISIAGLFSSWYLTKKSGVLRQWEGHVLISLMVWGLAWWFWAGFCEIDQFVAREDQIPVMLTYTALSFMLTDLASRRLAWKAFSYPALLLLPAMGIVSLHSLDGQGDMHLFAGTGALAWVIAFCVQYRLLFNCEKIWLKKALPLLHRFTLWILIFILTRESAFFVDLFLPTSPTWRYCTWGIVPGISILSLISIRDRLFWPIRRFHEVYLGWGAAIPLIYLFAWTLFVNFYHGDPAPLPFVPLLNPVELTQAYILILILKWIGLRREWLEQMGIGPDGRLINMIFFGAGFLLLNAMVARTIHFRHHVPYTVSGMYHSVLLQAALSILWGVTALVATLVATRKGSRPAWIAGASILSLVVLKLFIIDLAGTGTIARIVSFLGVGSLMLIIGYFSPLPPARTKEDS